VTKFIPIILTAKAKSKANLHITSNIVELGSILWCKVLCCNNSDITVYFTQWSADVTLYQNLLHFYFQ